MIIRLLVLLLAAWTLDARALEIKVLEAGDYAKLIQNAPRPTMVTFWSIDCVPCHRELPELARLARIKRFASLILISTDDAEQVPAIAHFIEAAKFPATTRVRVFGNDPARLRHEIDPTWSGETPRHYFFIAKQAPRAWSGPLKLGLGEESIDH